MTTTTAHQDAGLTRAAYYGLAGTTAIIGLAASAIAAKFFILGLDRTESDPLAREALVAAGVLMIVVELAAFGLAALLPRDRLRALRLRLVLTGVLLVGFEVATIYMTQYLIVRGADAQQRAADSRIQYLTTTLAGQQQAAAELRTNAARDSASPYPWIRQHGAATLREAAALEAKTAPLAQDLAQLQEQKRPTMTDALGESGTLAYSGARALLTSVVGLVMIGACGALLRAAREVGQPAAAPVVRPTFANSIQSAPTGAPAAVPTNNSALRWLAAGIPLAAAPAAFAAPSVTVTAPAPAEMPTAGAAEPLNRVTDDDRRYQRILAGVRAGEITPSVRAIQAAERETHPDGKGCATTTAMRYLRRMARDGVIDSMGRGYVLRGAPADTRQMDLISTAA